MTQTLLTIVADLELSLAAAVSVGATTATLSTATDADGVALPSGKYGFTIDGDNSAKEFIVADLAGTALTGILSVTKQGATSSGFANYHRVGATVTITDWVVLKRMMNNLDGSVGFDAGNPINYDAEPSYSDPLTIPTVQFVLDTASGGTVTFDAEVIAGDAGETVADGEWVYLNTTDGEWYLTDADDSAKSMNVKIGKARGAGTNGNPIVGGIFTAGLEKVGTYTPGQAYYLSNTAGALSTSAGTNSVIVGYGDANGELVMDTIAPNAIDASRGGSTFGNPSASNKFITQEYNASATGLPVIRTYTVSSLGGSTTRFDITNTAGSTWRYTWDGTGTDPVINTTTVPTGAVVAIWIQGTGGPNDANDGVFTVTGSGTNYFEVTNASGVAEADNTLGSDGYLKVSRPQTWTKPTGLKYIIVESVGGGAGGAGYDTDDAGGYGKGGASAGYTKKLIAAASLGSTESVTAGVGGIAGVDGTSPIGGAAGSNSTFGSHTTSGGGSATDLTETSANAGGTASGGDINLVGQPSGYGVIANLSTKSIVTGGDTPLGRGGYFDGTSKVNASGYGAGGAGAIETGGNEPGYGADGIVIVTEYYS